MAASARRAGAWRDGRPVISPLLAAFVALQLGVIAPARATGSEAGLRFVTAAGEAHLELQPGKLASLALPAGARIEAAAALAGGWIAAGTMPNATPVGRELLLLVGSGDGPAAAQTLTLPPPAGRIGKLLAEPLPLVAGGRLTGLVWLEGDDPRALGVRYAGWNGAAWSAAQTISAPGQGSQLALAAAHLAGGAWLLAWSAFDGHDDEIVWSWGHDGSWTPPRRLTDNAVPDITPALTASGRGALIAWSQLAGDGYRLLVARFRDGSFGEPEVVAPGGSLYPSFEPSPGAGRSHLLYRTAQPRGWAAIELDAGGRPGRQAGCADPPAPAPAGSAPTGALARPALLAGGGRATFDWLGAAAGMGRRLTAPWRTWQPPPAAPATFGGKRGGQREARTKDASVQTYAAFGDSITSGYGDPKGIGYPGRLEGLLSTATGTSVTVINDGLFGETTGEGLARIGSVLQPGVNAVLLMEGTNDINAKVSVGTIAQNLDLMADAAEAVGIQAVHATVIPRLSTADTDPTNLVTGTLAGAIRDLAWKKSRTLVDPFEVFFYLTPNAMTEDYLGGGDRLHPNAAGYDLLARTFADVLTGVDKVPPVTGLISPFNGQLNVPVNAEIQVDLYDFGTGIDVANTHLLLDGQAVTVTPTGDQSKLEFRYKPTAPLAGVVAIGLATQDLANPPNIFNGTIAKFEVVGTVFLPGDLNQDGIVDGMDLILFAYCFGAHRFDTNFQLYCDLNGDGIVDGRDLAILAANFGKRSF
ncbi:MAG TPA: GDSL-type esterase/lipase family protein [Thermoanaerobaculia bacterium]|nr:GDSL-type esterase/lipase family protein [Thermoanaerobaculia bacterium]